MQDPEQERVSRESDLSRSCEPHVGGARRKPTSGEHSLGPTLQEPGPEPPIGCDERPPSADSYSLETATEGLPGVDRSTRTPDTIVIGRPVAITDAELVMPSEEECVRLERAIMARGSIATAEDDDVQRLKNIRKLHRRGRPRKEKLSSPLL